MENWREILNNTELQDVEFEFLDREEKVGAHKLILASVSPVFKAMLFTSGLLESFGSISKIKIVDYSPADIREFMNYLYLGLVPLNFSITLWNLGAKYIVKGMLDALLRHFTKDIEHPKLYDDYIKLAKAQGLALWEESLQTQQLEIKWEIHIRFLDNEDVIKSDVWEFTVDDVRWVPMEDKN